MENATRYVIGRHPLFADYDPNGLLIPNEGQPAWIPIGPDWKSALPTFFQTYQDAANEARRLGIPERNTVIYQAKQDEHSPKDEWRYRECLSPRDRLAQA